MILHWLRFCTKLSKLPIRSFVYEKEVRKFLKDCVSGEFVWSLLSMESIEEDRALALRKLNKDVSYLEDEVLEKSY